MSGRPPLAAVLVATLAIVPVAANDRWISLRTAHLTIISHASEGATRTLAQQIERFIDGLSVLVDLPVRSDVPVTAFVFKDHAAFAVNDPGDRLGQLVYRGRHGRYP